MTHKELTKLVHGKTCKMERKVGNNTYARILHNGSIAVRLYSTDVVTIPVSYTHLTLPTKRIV